MNTGVFKFGDRGIHFEKWGIQIEKWGIHFQDRGIQIEIGYSKSQMGYSFSNTPKRIKMNTPLAHIALILFCRLRLD